MKISLPVTDENLGVLSNCVCIYFDFFSPLPVHPTEIGAKSGIFLMNVVQNFELPMDWRKNSGFQVACRKEVTKKVHCTVCKFISKAETTVQRFTSISLFYVVSYQYMYCIIFYSTLFST